MGAVSSKSLIAFGIILMIALALQAGAIKTLVSLQQPSALESARLAAVLEAPPAKRAPQELPAEPVEETAHPAAPNPQAAPDPTAQAAQMEAQALQTLATPEAAPNAAVPPAAPATSSPAQPGTPQHNPMTSNIPPPIQLEPEPASLELPPVPPAVGAVSPLEAALPAAEEAAVTATNELLEPDWLKGRDPKRYTVQLYSGKDMNKLREMAKASTDVAPPAYFTTTSRSGPWYSLVIGDFPDFNSAQAAATKLATQSGATKPWIRRFSEIQGKMR